MRRLWIVIVIATPLSAAWGLNHPVRIETGLPVRAAMTAPHAQAAGPNDATLGYDSGPVYYFPEATVTGTYWGVRFTPAQSCSLMTVSVYAFQGSGTVAFHFFTDSSGMPGHEFAAPQVHTLLGNLSLETIPLTAVDVGSQDFYIVMELMSGPPPYPVTDADGGSGRSWFRYPGQPWEHVVDFDIALRANVHYYGPDAVRPTIEHIPIGLAFSEAFSTEIRCRLTDASGISSAWVYYRPAGQSAFDSTVLAYLAGDRWQAELPPYPAGTDVDYFIRAWDGSANRNTASDPDLAPSELLRYRVHPGTEIAYDDGSPEIFFYLDTSWTGNAFAVRMTPPVYPARVNLLRAFVNDTTSFQLEIRVPVGDSAGGLLAGPYTVRAVAPLRWVDFVIPEAERPLIAAGDFVAILRWRSASPTSPAVGADSTAGSAVRSYSYDGKFGWFKYPMFDWLIRAAVESPTGVIEIGSTLPVSFELDQNFPNPFNPSTRIAFALNEPANVTLSVYNLLGQKVRMLVDEQMQAGSYAVDFDARDMSGHALPSGLYFYRLDDGRQRQTKKMILMR
jgi:hypothetical protein